MYAFNPGRLAGKPLLYSEIMEKCREHGVCPYYAQQELLGYADLVGLSYNYIVHEGIGWAIRNKLPFRLCNLVVDEAHNLRRAGNVNSDKITLGTLRYAIGEKEEFDTSRGNEVREFLEDMWSEVEEMRSRLRSEEGEDTFEPMEFLRSLDYEDPVSYLKRVFLRISQYPPKLRRYLSLYLSPSQNPRPPPSQNHAISI
ncbi:hypothetical protein AKJ57_02805 [candidate division MSBL1 archaeon SCGC-AAA259A05]|uniref:Helicase ATP-binding domain-containing protein n=1 Tax=candidate division MSBL1 archaeon SCGC-AAA259A05 TaxID=1698259 RepID=A0A133UA00_9EURY|nr:hypothetical protein AKJ57_02805 [candidate division MSBL1 archaeon SCGC-AAA259A05]